MEWFLTYIGSTIDLWIVVLYSVGITLTVIGSTLYIVNNKKAPYPLELIKKLFIYGIILITISLLLPSGVVIDDMLFAGLLN